MDDKIAVIVASEDDWYQNCGAHSSGCHKKLEEENHWRYKLESQSTLANINADHGRGVQRCQQDSIEGDFIEFTIKIGDAACFQVNGRNIDFDDEELH